MTAIDPQSGIQSATLSGIDYASLKSGGIIMQRDDDFFAIRLRLPGGSITAEELSVIARVAKRYGRTEVHLTARQGIEIPWIRFKDIEPARRELDEAGISLGPCGPRFRTVTACPGLPICKKALSDSRSFARAIESEFIGMKLPHKFTATVSACPNGCSRPVQSDIGFCAAAKPKLETEACIGCGLCLDICRDAALVQEGGKPVIEDNRCISCADCIDCCPTGAWSTERGGYSVYAGGRMGRHPALGKKIADFVDEETGLEVIRRCLDFYIRNGRNRERFGDLINRIGQDEFASFVLQGGINCQDHLPMSR